jgi:AcrR family transcriptional regulator
MSGDHEFFDGSGHKEQRQRERLCIAFVQAMADGGYEAITVARVSELSGCSQETFHRHYEDLADCFCDACSYSLQESRSATVSAWLTARGWSRRLRQSCHALLRHVEEHPGAARAVLVDSLTGGPEVADHVREVVAFHERALVMGFQLHPEGFATSRLTPRALTGGMRHILHLRLTEDRESEISQLADDLHEWIECLRSSAAARLPISQREPAPQRPSATVPALPQPERPPPAIFPGAEERSRVLDTVTQLMLQQGREALDGATVARFAGISAARFASEYGGLAACVTGIVDRFVDGNGTALAAGAKRGESWPESVRLAVVESMRHLDANRGLTKLVLLRLSLVPEVCAARHAAISQRIVSVALENAPPPLHAKALVAEALPGAVNGLLTWAVATGAFARLPALANHIAFFTLAPYLGGEAAAEAVIASADAEWLGRHSDHDQPRPAL